MSKSRFHSDKSKAPGYLARKMKRYARNVADCSKPVIKPDKTAPAIPLRKVA